MENESQRHNDKRRVKTSLKIICTSHFIVTFVCERELETEHNCNIFSFFRAAQPEAQGPTMLAFFTASYQQLLWTRTQLGAPSPFGLMWLSLPNLVYNSSNSSCLTSVLTELYNSSTSTQSPTQSLEWHV